MGESVKRLGAWRRGALLALALLALAVKTLVPAGYMLSPTGADGRVAIVLCGAHGAPVEAVLDLASGKILDADAPPGDADERQNDPAGCLFAGAAPLASAPIEPGLSVPPPRTFAQTATIAHARPGRGLAAPPPWPTGPPRIA